MTRDTHNSVSSNGLSMCAAADGSHGSMSVSVFLSSNTTSRISFNGQGRSSVMATVANREMYAPTICQR